jgi:phage repressor protein C with HTH and peptisase S24 domain
MKHADVWRAIDRLAARRGLSPSGLARRSGLDPTTFNKSKRITKEGKRRWPSTESLAKVLEAAGASLAEFVALIGADEASALSQRIPLVAFDQAGVDHLFDETGRPSGEGWDEVLFPQLDDPDAFALEIGDQALAPTYRAGDTLVLSPQAGLRRGDRVVLKLKDGRVLAGALLRRGVRRVQVAPLAEGGPEESLETGQIAWMARIIWSSQ